MPPREFHDIEELRALCGQEVAASGWVTVTQQQIDAFAQITGDSQWIHVDRAKAAAESPYGATIAHGFLTLSLISMLAREAFRLRGDFRMMINYGLNRVRFPAPAPAGSKIRGRFTLHELQEFGGGWQIIWAVTVEVEGASKPCLAAEWLVRAYR